MDPKQTREIGIRGRTIGDPATFTLIAGPCAVESSEQTLEAAHALAAAGATMVRGGASKPRTSPHSFQGLGREGLQILAGHTAQLERAAAVQGRTLTNPAPVLAAA